MQCVCGIDLTGIAQHLADSPDNFWRYLIFGVEHTYLTLRHICVRMYMTMTLQWVPWRLKSPASRMLTQPFNQAEIKENIKALRHWPLCGEFTGDRWIPRTNGQWRGKCLHLMTSPCLKNIHCRLVIMDAPSTNVQPFENKFRFTAQLNMMPIPQTPCRQIESEDISIILFASFLKH